MGETLSERRADGPSYLNRGRARELYQRMDELERNVDRRLAAIESRIEDMIALELELERRRLQVGVELLREFNRTQRGPT